MKYKKWVESVERVRGDRDSRFDKLRLDKNERLSNFDGSFWKDVISKITQEHILAYPEVEPLYERLARFLGRTQDNIVITAGSDFAIKIAFELFVNPGDKVVYLDPTFAMVDVYCGLYRAERAKIGYNTNLEADISGLSTAIDESVSLIVIANPNSPTGTYIPNDTLSSIVLKAGSYGIPVLVDEAYYGFCPYTALDILDEHPNLMVTRTFSKTAGLAGLRIGYIVAQPNLAALLYKFRPMYEVNSIAVLFMAELMDHWHIVEEYIRATAEGKQYLLSGLEALSIKTIDTLTNFIHADFGTRRTGVLDAFRKDGILVRGSLPVKGFEGYSRISVGTVAEMEILLASIRRNYGVR
ncbi:MAG: histidinol-phosphate aminotransferase family protein [Nitrospirae bacterium]|nr:histidinol-phosphate aminotransferase family protein [Nitrospirota bacterium]